MEAALTTERHYTVQQVADEWAVSTMTIRRLFESEPGVLCIGDRLTPRKRKYVTIRIPEHVNQRVRMRLEVTSDRKQQARQANGVVPWGETNS